MTDASEVAPRWEPERPSVGGQLVIPVVAIIFTTYFFTTIIHSPWTAQVNAVLIGSILIVLSVLQIGKLLLQVRRGEADMRMSLLYSREDLTLGRVYLLIVTLAYIYLIEWGGFTITTFFFLLISMLILNRGRHKRMIMLVSAGLAIGGYLLFILAFDTRFHRGPFEAMVGALLKNGN